MSTEIQYDRKEDVLVVILCLAALLVGTALLLGLTHYQLLFGVLGLTTFFRVVGVIGDEVVITNLAAGILAYFMYAPLYISRIVRR